ncbi:RRM domain-containing RNA-binding protein [Xenococcus sp. PCC 7305]|uniref:RNA recognition motif domain-containing protein n=1 Tax=Xenococcus sp. PCC 7305 TaxID=102125 RepID=UPI0002ABD4E3|nr:RNA-binding protein [Xenococcus sp. PCC 7305]ELS01015.1 RRM domain-containing RNA-binding protein [Xenococcus sp. PCC 7305]
MSIFIGNLSYEASEQDLIVVFAEYGSVQEVKLITDRDTGRMRGFGFVRLETLTQEEAAIAALDGAEWMGRTLKVNKANEQSNRNSHRNRRRN